MTTKFSPSVQICGYNYQYNFKNVAPYLIAVMLLFQFSQRCPAQTTEGMISARPDTTTLKLIDKSPLHPLDYKIAMYRGGSDAFVLHLIKNLRMPASYGEPLNVNIAVTFTVEANGKLKDFHASNGPGDLQNEAIHVVKTSGKWIPAYRDGKPIESQLTQNIRFINNQ